MSSPTKKEEPGMSWDAEPHLRRKPWNPRTEMARKEKEVFPECPISQKLPCWLSYFSHSWDHWLTTFQRFLFSKWVKFFSGRKSFRTDWLSSSPLGWIWVEILRCGYIIIPFFFLYCLVTPGPLGLLKKENYVGFTKAGMIDAGIWFSSPLRPLI